MRHLTPTEKGGIAEAAIAAAAVRLGIVVSRPIVEGGRYDLIFDNGDRLQRVQCKWGCFRTTHITVRTSTSRHTPRDGYLRTTYSTDEVDLLAVFCVELEAVYVIPIEEIAGQSYLHLRLTPARNNQARGVKWAAKYRFGAVAQLGERPAGSREVRGSSPLSSM